MNDLLDWAEIRRLQELERRAAYAPKGSKKEREQELRRYVHAAMAAKFGEQK